MRDVFNVLKVFLLVLLVAAIPMNSLLAGDDAYYDNAANIVDKTLLETETYLQEDLDWGLCTVTKLKYKFSAPGLKPFIATETYYFCGHSTPDKSDSQIRSGNVTQYGPGGTCAKGDGFRSIWQGSGTIQMQYVSFERNGKFYTASGSGIGMEMAATFYWSISLTSEDRIYAATMRTSGALSGAGTSCF